MANTKKYVITSITLGIIAAASAGLIGLANLATKDKIAENEMNKIKSGLVEIFGKNATIGESKSVNEIKDKIGANRPYLEHYYSLKEDENTIGYAFRTSGSNEYGKITLIVGFINNSEATFKGMSVVVNEQTFATTLVENYIDPVNGGKRDISDTSCDATYGATLIKNMINEAQEATKKLVE